MIPPPIFEFARFLRDFQAINREVDIDGRLENDAEHSFQLAMVAWWIASEQKLKLRTDLLLKYALVHDVVEVFAGDVNPLTGSKEALAQKSQKEQVAALEIAQKFPTFKELHTLIEAYNQKLDEEAKFVYIIDKILPIINIHLSNSDWYQQNAISQEKYRAWLNSCMEKVTFNDKATKQFIEEVIIFLSSQKIFAK